MNLVHFSSKTDLWSTPQAFFDALNAEFGFTLDVCATAENAKCGRYFTLEDNGLEHNWKGRIFCNPPYGREIGKWVQKAQWSVQVAEIAELAVLLLPARTDTAWFQDYVLPYAELRWVRGRLKFGNAKHSAPFPSVVAVYRGRNA